MDGKYFSCSIVLISSVDSSKRNLSLCNEINVKQLAEKLDKNLRWDLIDSSEAQLVIKPKEYRKLTGKVIDGRSQTAQDKVKTKQSETLCQELSAFLKDNGYNVSGNEFTKIEVIFKIKEKDKLRDTLKSFCQCQQ